MALATRAKPKAHTRKRQAGHHRRNKRYLKTYWPYLPMLLVVVIGLAINGLWSNSTVLGTSSNLTATALLQDTNAQRLADREAALALNPQLGAAAQAKANDMATRDYWAHTSPDGRTPWSFLAASGYQYQAAGENLAYGFTDATTVTTGWMNSAEHRANLLDPAYRDVGFGVAESVNYQGHGPQVVVVAEYAQPVGAANAADQYVQAVRTGSASQPVSRIQLLTGGQASWTSLAAAALAGAALTLLLVRHGLRLKRLVFQSETYLVHHPLLDLVFTIIFMAGFVLTRTSGLIR